MAKLLGFQERRAILQAARSRGGGGAIGTDEGLGVSTELLLAPTEMDAIRGSRSLKAILNRVLANAGKRGVSRVQRHIRSVDAIKTRLFISAWRQERFKESQPFNTAVALVNPTPYALYVHPKGTPRHRTIVNYYVRGEVVPTMAVEISEDLDRLRGKIGQATKEMILSDRSVVRGLFEEEAANVQARFAP